MTSYPDHPVTRRVLAIVLILLGAEAAWPVIHGWIEGGPAGLATGSVLLVAGVGIWRETTASLHLARAALWIQLALTIVTMILALAVVPGAGSGPVSGVLALLAPAGLNGITCVAALLWVRRRRIAGARNKMAVGLEAQGAVTRSE